MYGMIDHFQETANYPFRFDVDASLNFHDLMDLRSELNYQQVNYVNHKTIFLFETEHDLNIFKLLI